MTPKYLLLIGVAVLVASSLGAPVVIQGTRAHKPLGLVAQRAQADDDEDQAEHKHMRLVAHNDLNGNGDGGEGMAIQQLPDGRRILYLAHEGQKICLSMLAVANQASGTGRGPAGFWLLDVSNVDRAQTAGSLQDLALSFFDTSGPHSRGVHWLWFVDGEFVHLSTGAADFTPTNRSDDQFDMVVDVRDPRSPREVGRWWLPGTQVGDPCLPGCLPQRLPIDTGYRAHNVEVFPERPDRAYIGYIDGQLPPLV